MIKLAKMTSSEYEYFLEKIENALSSSELRKLKEYILENYDSDDEPVKKLVRRM